MYNFFLAAGFSGGGGGERNVLHCSLACASPRWLCATVELRVARRSAGQGPCLALLGPASIPWLVALVQLRSGLTPRLRLLPIPNHIDRTRLDSPTECGYGLGRPQPAVIFAVPLQARARGSCAPQWRCGLLFAASASAEGSLCAWGDQPTGLAYTRWLVASCLTAAWFDAAGASYCLSSSH